MTVPNETELHFCRVCGLYHDDPPYGHSSKVPSFEICVCCGVEFGYEDTTADAAEHYRKRWIENGANWFDPSAKPRSWSLEAQLEKVRKVTGSSEKSSL